MRKRIRLFSKVTMFTLYFLFGHLLIFAVFLFATPFMIGETDISYTIDDILSPAEKTTYAHILDDRVFSLEARVALIEAAEETAYMSSFSVSTGEAKNVVLGALHEAAERGVEVKILLDAVSRYGTVTDYNRLAAVAMHENIELRLYEPLNFLLPHTLNNRFHDKMFLVDNQFATSGGRNLADRYFLPHDDEDQGTFDRDVLIFGDPGETIPAVADMHAYFLEVFHHDFSRPLRTFTSNDEALADIRADYEAFIQARDMDDIMDKIIADAIKVDNATFVRGPIERGMKYPVVLETLAALAETEDEWFIQSPFIIFSSPMRDFLPDYQNREITILTNNTAYSPNPFARGGYLHHREDLASIATLYEFQSTASIHGKTMVFGDSISVIGAYNLDPRSTFMSTENMVVIVGEEFTEELMTVLDTYVARSLEVNPDGSYVDHEDITPIEPSWRRRMQLRFTYVVAYFFDFML